MDAMCEAKRENGVLRLRSSACLYSPKWLGEGMFSQVRSSDQRTVPNSCRSAWEKTVL